MNCDIKDIDLAPEGDLRVEWADQFMPVLRLIRERFDAEKPLKNTRISACLHVTTETANLMRTLKAGGAEISLCASNPLSTQDDVAATLVKDYDIPVFAIKGEDRDTYYAHINSALNPNSGESGDKPMITMDDGADLVSMLHSERSELIGDVVAGTEETTTGVIRLKSMATEGVLKYPIIAVNDAKSKHLFDNYYGTGQSTMDGIIRATNRLIAGSTVVIAGYGWCGKGAAIKARGLGARVIVTEVDPLKALQAVMDGYQVMPMSKAAERGDVFVTLTGDISVLNVEHFELMKDGAIICNSGHFNVEIDIDALEKISVGKRRVRSFVDEYTLKSGKKINLLGEGRLVNLAAAEGHPASVMDMSFANQALSAEFIVKNGSELENKVYAVPDEIDSTVAMLKLKALGIEIDELTDEQKKYLESWTMGT